MHAELLETVPANGDVLDTAPEQVLLTFSEPVDIDGDSIEVLDSEGDEVDVGDLTRPDGGRGVAAAVPRLGDGAYVVGWHVVSTDSHPIRGAFVFRVGEPADAAAADAEAQALMDELVAAQGGDTTVGVLYGIVRFATFAGLILLVGGTAFVLLVWPDGIGDRRVRRLVVGGWWTALVATVLSFGFQGAYTTGEGVTGVVDASAIADVLGTRAGGVWLVRLALLVLVAGFALWLLLQRPAGPPGPAPSGDPGDGGRAGDSVGGSAAAGRESLGGSGGGTGPGRSGRPELTQVVHAVPVTVWGGLGLALLGTVSLAGHAGAGDLVPLALVADVAHLAAVSFWLAGLAILLLVVLSTGRGELQGVVARFSTLAAWAVAVIAVSGTVQAWRQIGSIEALTDTTYGRLILIKVLLVGAVLGAAAFSRQWVRSRAAVPASVGPGGARVEVSGGAVDADDSETAPGLEMVDDPSVTAVADQPGGATAAAATGTRPAPSRLRRSVLAEVAGAVVVLAVTALLVNTVPAEDDLDPTFTTEVHGPTLMVTVEVEPARAGTADVRIETRSHTGQPVEPDEVTASLSLPERDLGPIELALEPGGSAGTYVAHDAEIPYAGTWELEVLARTGQFDQDTVVAEVPVR